MLNIPRIPHGVGQWISGVVIGSCGFVNGLALAWSAIFYLKQESGEIDVKFNNHEKSFVASLFYLGPIITTIVSSYMQEKIGRRGVLLLASNFSIVSWIIIYFFHNIWGILVARLLSGMWTGFVITTCPSYMSEIAGPKLRGRISALLTVLAVCGLVFQSYIGTILSYNGVAICSLIISVTQFLCILSIPESVYILLSKNKIEQAERNLKWLLGQDEIVRVMSIIRTRMDEQLSRKRTYKELFSWPASRKAFFQAIFLVITQRFSGYHAIMSYSSIILPHSCIKSHQFPMIWNFINLVFLIISVCCVDFIDRRTLLFISCLGCSIFSFSTSLWFYLNEKTEINVSDLSYLALTSLCIHAAFYAVGLLYIPIVFQGEVFPMNVKAKATGLIAFGGYVTAILMVQLFLPLKVLFGMYFNFLMYGVFSMIGSIMTLKIVETRNKTLENIQAILEGRSERDT